MGLRRHEVENLVLGGPIFYWRARIPVGFEASGRNARLSLSHRLSDRKKASVVARRLNALLLQMEMMPRARMATKEQLGKTFALEAEAIREEIEALDRAAKRTGTIRDPDQCEADRQVGCAYRLLHTYDTGEAEPVEEAAAEAPLPIVVSATKSAPARTRKAPKELPLSGFDEELEILIANHRDDWEDDTGSDVRVLVGRARGFRATDVPLRELFPPDAVHLSRAAPERTGRADGGRDRQVRRYLGD